MRLLTLSTSTTCIGTADIGALLMLIALLFALSFHPRYIPHKLLQCKPFQIDWEFKETLTTTHEIEIYIQ